MTRATLTEILLSGIILAIGTICVFAYKIGIGVGERKAMTVAFTLFVMYQLFNAYNGKANSNKKSTYLYAAILISFILQLFIIYVPQLQIIFRTTSIGMMNWIVIVIVAFTIIIADKIMKKVIE